MVGPGKYIAIGQGPASAYGGRYGVTIQNGQHFCALRVVSKSPGTDGAGGTGDTILSWGNKRLRFRYEGTSWPAGGNGPAHKTRSRDVVVVHPSQVTVFGGITSNAYYYRSDVRYKEAIEPIQGALGKVLGMQGVSFFMREPDFEPEIDEEKAEDDFLPMGPLEGASANTAMSLGNRRLGLVAQEVEKVCPEVVATDDDGYKSLDVTQLNAVLVEAVKDQQKIIDTQQARLERLERALAKLGIEI
ncbi:MAG TPA: tail fiber domain-containing protein [Polyangium sp.]|nr:tail fiber domain-containing protein [Polyangium sp.]